MHVSNCISLIRAVICNLPGQRAQAYGKGERGGSPSTLAAACAFSKRTSCSTTASSAHIRHLVSYHISCPCHLCCAGKRVQNTTYGLCTAFGSIILLWEPLVLRFGHSPCSPAAKESLSNVSENASSVPMSHVTSSFSSSSRCTANTLSHEHPAVLQWTALSTHLWKVKPWHVPQMTLSTKQTLLEESRMILLGCNHRQCCA